MIHLSKNSENLEINQYYNGLTEASYPSSHPLVTEWMNFFVSRFRERKIFEEFNSDLAKTKARSRSVALSWHQFSEFMPYFLCQASAMMSNNQKRHYVIQTAFEELGMRDAQKIHHEMFWSAVQKIDPQCTVEKLPQIENELSLLKKKLLSSENDSYILGLLLGLEGPAEENIETLFESLAYDSTAQTKLEATEFFVVHRQIEIEHVKLTVSNFLRFCEDESSQAEFITGFDAGIDFWQSFWSSTKAIVIEAG